MSRSVRIVVIIAAVQAVLLGSYWLVENRRSEEGASSGEVTIAPPVRLDEQMNPLSLRTRDGSRFQLRAIERPTLLHFWATWCPPCRAELPGLLALPEEHPVEVAAVALDQEWADVDRFLDGRRFTGILLGDRAEVQRAFGVRTLPVTYFVEPGGRLRLRFDGARDWTDRAFVASWITDDVDQLRGP